LNLEDIAFVSPPESAEGLRTKVQQNDILITITGANVTKSALVEIPIENAYISQHVALVRFAEVRLSKFLFYAVISPAHGRKQLLEAAYGQGKPGLNLTNVREVVVGIPPLTEQEEIVHRVEKLFKLADAIEARYQKAKAHVDKLTQSILAKAFRGQLVPQDPKDEPATALLERLKEKKMEKPLNDQ
jgi:type I restriction enzyme S subunit